MLHKTLKVALLTIVLSILNICSCSYPKIEDSVGPTTNDTKADFSLDKTECSVPCMVTCSNKSTGTGTLSYEWNFGDPTSGTANTAILKDPTHEYKAVGSYTISLTTMGQKGKNTITKDVKITTPVASDPVPDFTFSFGNSSQFAPASVMFTNNSQNAVSYKWTFGDGAATSTQTSPNYTYNLPDGYTVKLEATNAGVTKSISKVVNINARKFLATFGSSDAEAAYSVQQTSDNGYILTGYKNVNPNSLLYLVKTDVAGVQTWEKTFTINSIYNSGYSVQQTVDGGYIVGGTTGDLFSGTSTDFYVIKTDGGGNLTWKKTFGGNNIDLLESIQQTVDGGYIFLGTTKSEGAGEYDMYLAKIDAGGNLSWKKTFGGIKDESGHSVQQTKDGGYILCGDTNSEGAGFSDIYLIKTDVSGNLTWKKTFGGTSSDGGYSVQQSNEGGYIVCGYTNSEGAGDYDVYLVKTDASGNLTWKKTFGGTASDNGYSVRQTTDGGYIVCGDTSSEGAGFSDVFLLKTDVSGSLTWKKTFGGTGSDRGSSVQQTSDGGYIICGQNGQNKGDVFLIKTDKDGNAQ
jgi:PKD repeat protein